MLTPPLNAHLFYVQEASKRLARMTFHKMMQYQQKLESKQSILNRIVDIGTDLFAIAAVCSYTDHLVKKGQKTALELADAFFVDTRARIESNFNASMVNHDRQNLKLAKKILAKEFEWLENEIIK